MKTIVDFIEKFKKNFWTNIDLIKVVMFLQFSSTSLRFLEQFYGFSEDLLLCVLGTDVKINVTILSKSIKSLFFILSQRGDMTTTFNYSFDS